MPDALKTTSKGRGRKISWDVIRAGCVVLVMIYHATYEGPLIHPELIRPRHVVFAHQVGASLLLTVSAYFICVTIGRSSGPRYLFGRLARLLPAYFAAVALVFAGTVLFAPHDWFRPTWRDFGANELMLWNWLPRFPFLDGSYWTIPLQLMGFAMAAILFRTTLGHGRRFRVVLWALVLIPIIQWPYRISGPPEWYRMIVDGFGFHRFHLFVAGIAIWMWSTKRLSHTHFVALMTACLFAHALHTAVVGPDKSVHVVWGSWAGIAVGLLLMSLAARGPDWNRIFPARTHRAIAWFAGISYGVYLMHQTMGYIVMRRLQDWHFGPTVQLLGMLVTGTLLGWALTKVVERPLQTRLMRWYDVSNTWVKTRLEERREQPVPAAAEPAAEPVLTATAAAPYRPDETGSISPG